MSRWWNKRQFDLVEVAFVSLLVGLVVLTSVRSRYSRLSFVAYSTAQEGASLEERYGPSKNSRNEEEWVIRDYFQDRRNGVFVDVGANHYRYDSNTYFLETKLGWSGIAIDPQVSYADGYRANRPRTRFFAFFVSDTSGEDLTLFLADANPLVASSDKAFTERGGTRLLDPYLTTRALTVPTIRLTDLLDRAGMSDIDLLSVDVELAEPKVLAGFDIDRFAPELVCIEAHPQVRQAILDYFAAHRYVVVGRYLRADLQNLYFAPASFSIHAPVERAPRSESPLNGR